MLRRAFSDHPASVGETYGEHFATAGGFAVELLAAGAACAVHAVLPFLFEKTGSRAICRLHERMVANRARCGAAAAPTVVAAPQHMRVEAPARAVGQVPFSISD